MTHYDNDLIFAAAIDIPLLDEDFDEELIPSTVNFNEENDLW